MKHILGVAMAALLAAPLAGCGAPQTPDYWNATRAGYGVETGAQPAAAGGNYRTGAEAALGPHAAMRPGLHQTRSGAPWLVAHSSGFQAKGSRLTGGQLLRRLLSIWRPSVNPPMPPKPIWTAIRPVSAS